MSSIAERMRKAGQRLVGKFSTGNHTLINITDKVYDAISGEVTTITSVEVSVPAARNMSTNKKKIDNNTSSNYFWAYISGMDLGSFIPEQGGVIVTPENTQHKISVVGVDQYKAVYSLLVYKKEWRD